MFSCLLKEREGARFKALNSRSQTVMGEVTDLQRHTDQLGAQVGLVLSKNVLQILLKTQQNIFISFKIFSNLKKILQESTI